MKIINGPIPGVCGADISSRLNLPSAIGNMAAKPDPALIGFAAVERLRRSGGERGGMLRASFP